MRNNVTYHIRWTFVSQETKSEFERPRVLWRTQGPELRITVSEFHQGSGVSRCASGGQGKYAVVLFWTSTSQSTVRAQRAFRATGQLLWLVYLGRGTGKERGPLNSQQTAGLSTVLLTHPDPRSSPDWSHVLFADGYSYEREAMESWIHKKKRTSPMTNLALPSLVLTPNRTLKMAINRWLETHEKWTRSQASDPLSVMPCKWFKMLSSHHESKIKGKDKCSIQLLLKTVNYEPGSGGAHL